MGTYDGTITGSPTFGAVKFSNGLTAVSDANRIDLGTSPLNFATNASWTVDMWLTCTGVANKVAIAGGASSNAWFIGMSAAGKVRVDPPGASGGFLSNCDSTATFNDGALHHVRVVMTTGTSMTISIDGVLDSTFTGTCALPTGTGTIGKYLANAGFAWPGAIDEVAIFNAALASTYSVPVAAYLGNESNLKALYHLDSTAVDSAGAVTATLPVIGEYGGTTVALSWAAASGGTGPYTYQVQRAPDSAGSPGTFANTGASQSGLTFTDTGLTASTKYWWRVVATDSLSVSGTSGNVTQTTLAAGLKYNRIDGVDPITGQAVLLLVPNAASAVPYNASNPTPLVMYFHARSGTQTDIVTDSLAPACVDALANAGYLMVASNAHGNNWGNQQGCDDYVAAYLWAIATYNVGKVMLWAFSMGGAAAWNCLSQQKIPNVVAIASEFGVASLDSMISVGTYAAEIRTKYGIAGAITDAQGYAGMNPVGRWGTAFRDVYVRLYASTSDVTVLKTTNADAMNTLIGASSSECGYAAGVVGTHGDASNYQPSDLAAFFARALNAPPPTAGRFGGVAARMIARNVGTY